MIRPRATALRGLSALGWTWAVVVLVAVVLVAVSAPVSVQLYGVGIPAALGLSAVHGAAMLGAMVRPQVAGAMSLIAVLVLMPLADPAAGPWPWAVPWLLTQLAVIGLVAARQSWRAAGKLVGAGLAGSLLIGLLARGSTALETVLSNLVLFGALATAAATVGGTVAELTRTRARLRRERSVSAEQQAQRELVEQKARIARDLHDVIAHSMSMISIRAASASARLGGLPDPVAEEFDAIADAARQALQEMRQVLTVLREEGAQPEHAPQPGLAEVPELVERARAAGHRVSLRLQEAEVDQTVAVTAYRIVQEALSNAVRHAPDSVVSVRVAPVEEHLEVEVLSTAGSDPALPADPDGPDRSGGAGILGMRERARAVGGSVAAGPDEAGGFAVRARLPRGIEGSGR